MSSEPSVTFQSEVTRTSSSVVEVKSPTNSNAEAQRTVSCAEGESGHPPTNDVQSRVMMRMTAPHTFSSSFVTTCHVDEPPGMELVTGASDVVMSSADSLSLINSASQRHVECPGCAARRVVYHTCNLQPLDQLAFHEYPLSPGALAQEFSLTSLQEGGEGTLTYSAQAPVSATHIQHSHGALPFGSHQTGTIRSPQCQHDCTHCTSAPEKHSEVDPYYSAYGEQLGTTGSQRFVSGSEVSRPCPVHGSETFVTSFNPTFDIPLYSNIPGHPYLPHYYVQPPSSIHRHPLPRRPLPTHLPGTPYAPFRTGGHHHCCPTLFHDGTTDVRRQFPGHYEPPASVIPDDHFHPNISTGASVSQSHVCPLHEEHEDLQLVTTHHSMASPEGNGRHGSSKAEPSSGSVAEAGTPGDVRPEESRTEDFGSAYRVREPEMFVVSTDVTNDDEEPSVLSPVASEDVPVMRKRKSESFVCDLDGSSVDGNLLNLSLASHLKSYSTDVARSHTPPERDTNSKREVEAPVADVTKAEDETQNARGMAFTIDFGNNLDSPEITEHWKQFTPYRIHAGIQQRASKTKSRLKEKSESLEGEQQQKKGTGISSGEGRASGTKIRSRSPGSRSVGGYISDGHASGISSDNEDASICSEMIGCIQGRRKFNRVSDPRSFLPSGPLPSKSQPSLVKAKPSSDRVVQHTKSAASGGPVRGSVVSKSARTTPSRDQVVSKTGTKKATDPKPVPERAASTKSEPPKRMVRSAKTASEATPGRRLPKRPCDDGEAGGKKDDEIIDVTSYLINRMLFPSDKASNGFKTKSRPTGVRDLRMGSPSSAPLHRASGAKRKPHDENIPDNVSETGTYTIEDDPQTNEVQKARDDIGVVFGVDEESKADRLVRPVIEGTAATNVGPGPSGHDEVTTDHAVGEEDVFEYEPDRGLQEDYKLQVSEAVSSAISATKAIQKALLQKTSRSRTSSEGGVGKATEVVAPESSESHPSSIKSVNQISSSNPSADLGRQCATDVYDEGDFGTFAISFDAPSPKLRDSSCLSQEDASSSAQEMTAWPNDESSPAAEADHGEDERIDDRLKYANDVQLLMQSVDATVQELHIQMCKRSADLKSSGVIPSHTVQRPSREATFVKEIPPKDTSSSRVASQPRSTTVKAPSSASGRRTRDYAASDAGSESETASLSSMDYSMTSSRFTRASILRSSTGKGPVPVPRVNRTFALRCSKASGSESDSTGALVPRSRSAGNDSRLALRDAASRSTSRSRSRPRVISPASDVSRATAGQRNPARRRDLEQQHSEDSSASICSSISSRGSSTFIRKDGGRYSMRTEKSSLGPIPINANRTKDKKLSKPKSAGSQSSRDRPGSGGSATSQRQMTTAQAKELNAWKRRKQYDPRKAVADAKAKGGAHGISKHSNGSQSEPEDGAAVDDDYSPRRPTEESERATEIAQLSNAVAYNLNVLAESTRKDAVNLDEVRLQKLPVFSCDSNTRSAFSALHISGSHKAHSIPLVASDHNTSIEETEKSTYDNVLVNSIQQVSRKVKVLTDQLITKVRDEKRRGGSVEGPTISPLSSGSIPTWEHASPELTSILENLKKTEQHLQVVHKAMFSGNVKGRSGPETQRHQTVERQRVLAERGGFKPIEKPASATTVRKRSTSRKQSSLSTNPLSGDEYY